MTLSSITTQSPAATPTADKTLSTACHEFEGLLLGNILKQGVIHQPDEDEEDQGGGNGALLTEYAAEQTARSLSYSDGTGLAAILQRQMRTPGT